MVQLSWLALNPVLLATHVEVPQDPTKEYSGYRPEDLVCLVSPPFVIAMSFVLLVGSHLNLC